MDPFHTQLLVKSTIIECYLTHFENTYPSRPDKLCWAGALSITRISTSAGVLCCRLCRVCRSVRGRFNVGIITQTHIPWLQQVCNQSA
jgi:hypothetical protein